MMLSMAGFGLLVGLLGTSAAAPEDSKSLEGAWAMTSFEQNGEAEAPERIKGRVLTIEDGKFKDKLEDQVVASGTIKVDTSKTPWTIDATFDQGGPEGETVRAIGEMKDGKLRICASEPGGDRPTRFESGNGSGSGAYLAEYEKKK